MVLINYRSLRSPACPYSKCTMFLITKFSSRFKQKQGKKETLKPKVPLGTTFEGTLFLKDYAGINIETANNINSAGPAATSSKHKFLSNGYDK